MGTGKHILAAMAVSEDGKRAIAREVAFGIDKSQIARVRGLTSGGLSNMLNSPDMQELVRNERDVMATRMAFAMVHLNDQIEQSVKNVIAIANDLEHKDSYRANTDLIAMFRPPKQESDQKVEININTEVVNAIGVELTKIMSVHAKFDPSLRLLTGDQAKVTAFGVDPESKLVDALRERNSLDE